MQEIVEFRNSKIVQKIALSHACALGAIESSFYARVTFRYSKLDCPPIFQNVGIGYN